MLRYLALLLVLLAGLQQSVAAPDARMQVDLVAEQQGVSIRWLHSHIRQAPDLALPQLWQRIVPLQAMAQIPEHVKAVRFLQKAVPNEQGVTIVFNQTRVFRFLKQHQIPYYAEQSAAAVPAQPADAVAPENGEHAALPLPGLPAGLPETSVPTVGATGAQTALLTVIRQASLPEQVLFEEDLLHDPHVLSLTLQQVNRDRQQYRLQLRSADDQWLRAWFRSRGMTLTPSLDGWVAQ